MLCCSGFCSILCKIILFLLCFTIEGFGVAAEKRSINKFLSLSMFFLLISSTFC